MALHVTRPTAAQLTALAQAAANDEVTYAPIGVTTASTAPDGYRLDRHARQLGHGRPAFERAREALRTWQMHTASGLDVAETTPPTVGAVVAMAASLPIGYIDVLCRVVAVDDESDRYGFTYGTLPTHPEQGEESFAVSIDQDGTVTAHIVAVSRSRHPLSRAAPPVARWLQRRATTRYLDAIQALASETGDHDHRS